MANTVSLVGSHVGRIRIESVLGRGGMGEVYVGYDETLGRQVALKSILAGQRLREETKARFLREARVLSRLDHPHICRIYDYIQEEDRDFLVLELIRGKSLRQVIAEGVVEPAKALRIAKQIAQALVTAHTEGIVHRDLKPGNVMITDDGEVKVLDFGLARPLAVPSEPAAESSSGLLLTDDDSTLQAYDEGASVDVSDDNTPAVDFAGVQDLSGGRSGTADLRAGLQTVVGQAIGTPGYMSPEQALGRAVTTASDMFSFGLLLQALFTNKSPYPSRLSSVQVFAWAQSGETLPVKGLPVDIAHLIEQLKLVAPAARPTAATAVEKLQRIIDKPKRRLRRVIAAAILAVTTLGALKYTIDLRDARNVADRRRAQAEDLISFMVGDLRDKLEPVGRLDILDDVGEKALDYFASLDTGELADEELLRYSKVLTQISDVRIVQGRFADATASLEVALHAASDLVARDPENGEAQYGLAQVRFWLGNVGWLEGDLESADAHLQSYLEIAERLVDIDPTNQAWRLELAYAHSNLGTLMNERARAEGALEQFRHANGILRSLVESDPTHIEAQVALAETLSWLGSAQIGLGDLRASLERYLANLAAIERLCSLDPENTQWLYLRGISFNRVGFALELLGKDSEAQARYEKSFEIQGDLWFGDKANSDWAREVATARLRLGGILLAQSDLHAALAHYREGTDILSELQELEPSNAMWRRDRARGLIGLGETQLALGFPSEARDAANQATKILKEVVGEGEDRDAERLMGESSLLRGLVLLRAGLPHEAAEHWTAALEVLEPLGTNSRHPEILEPLARALLRLDRLDEATTIVEILVSSGYGREEVLRLSREKGIVVSSRGSV